MQAGEERMNTASSKIHINESSLHDNKHNSRRKISKNSNEFREESGHKSAENTLHHDHPEDQEQHSS